jgi:MFS transporter, putative metabolite:H+ symporter
VLAPPAVPQIHEWGGTALLFGIFGAVFLIAAVGALGLPERPAQILQD